MNEINRPHRLINSYGVIGDCHSVVLVSPDGSVDWGCLPDFDSPAIFCRLLDTEHGGYCQIAPVGEGIPGTQRYLPGSNVSKTHFTSIAGEIVSTDFMPVETLSAWPYKGMNNNTWTHEDGFCYGLVRIKEELVEGTALPPKYEERTRESRNHLCSFFAQLSRTQSQSLRGIGI